MVTSTYLGYRFYAADLTKSLQRTAAEPVVARDTTYYEANIGKVKSVDEFTGNFRLFSYAMKAYGLDDMIYAKAFMKKVLQSDLTDSHSFVNKLTDTRYKAFAQAFSFVSTGKVLDTTAVQSTDQQTDTTTLYSANTAIDATTSAAELKYYNATIGSVKTVDDLTGNARLYNVLLAAYGINATTTSQASVKAALESDISDPKSVVNTSQNTALQRLVADFNFSPDGTVSNRRLVQSQANFKVMAAAYTANAGTTTAATAAAKTETTYVGNAIATATSLDGLLKDTRVVAYIGKAFGVPSLDAATLRQVLTSDPLDSKSKANTMGDPYRQIAAAFDFSVTGTVTREPVRQAQSRSNIAAATSAYLEHQMESEASDSGEGVRLALYFKRQAPTITSVYQILADKALLKVVQTALGIPSTTSSQNIDVQAKMITSRLKLADLQDPKRLDKFIAQFTALYDIANFSTDSSSSTGLQLSSSV